MRQFHPFLLLAGVIAFAAPVFAQSDTAAPKPYATLDRQAVTYLGPSTARESDLPSGTAIIGLILPLQGPQQLQGKTILAAAQLALEEEQAGGPLPDGRKLALAIRDESGPWGQASSEILKLIDQDHALVVLTSANGSIAHQAEQLANKLSFPILTLASDPTTTQANVPWLFRLVPSDADQARAFSHRIYTELGLQKVLLVAQANHDGRIGSTAFQKAAANLNAPSPDLLETSAATNLDSLTLAIQSKPPQAIVLWTDAELASQLLPIIRAADPSIPIFLSTKAAQLGAARQNSNLHANASTPPNAELFSVMPMLANEDTMLHNFEQRFRGSAGATPGMAALEAYAAIHTAAEALRAVGTNRVLLRDYLAMKNNSRNAAGIIPFDPAGNCLEKFAIVQLSAMPRDAQ